MQIGNDAEAGARPCLLIENFLSPSECQALRERLEALGICPTGMLYPASYRNNDRLVLDDEALAATLYERIAEHAPSHLHDGERSYERTRLNPRFRCCRYRDGQRFTIHRDGIHHAAPDERSLLTFMIYLNGDDEFTGGRTRYYTDQTGRELLRAVVPKRGACILFDHALWHDGEAVHEGTKYVLRSDVLYRELSGPAARPHPGYVFCLLPLPGAELAAGSRDRRVRIYGPELEVRATLSGPTSSIACLAYAGSRLWSGDRDGYLRSFRAIGAATSDGFLEDSQRRAHEGAVLCLGARTREGADELISGGADGVLRSFRVDEAGLAATPHAELRGHRGFIHALLCTAEALWSAGEDGTLRRYPSGADSAAAVADFGQPIHSLASDGEHLYAGLASGELLVLEPTTLAMHARVQAHQGAVRALATLPGGRLASGGEDCAVVIHSLPALTPISRSWHRDFVTALAVRSDGTLISASYDGTLRAHPDPA